MVVANPVPPEDGDELGVAPYLAVRSATTPAWLAGGRLAYLDDTSGVPQVWVVGTDGGGARPLTDFPDRVSALAAAPAGDRLVFGMDRGGDERHQLWLLAAEGGAPRALTADPGTIHLFGAFSPDGRRFAFASNARDRQFFDLATIDLDDPAASPRLVAATDELLDPLAWSPDGQWLLARRQNTNLDHDLFLVPLAGGERRHLTPHAGEATVAEAAFAPAGDAVYAVSNQDRDLAALVRIDLATGRQDVLAAPDWDVEALAVAPHGDRLAYAVNEDGASRVVVRDLGGAERSVAGLPLAVAEGLTWSPDGESLAFGLNGARHPSQVWVAGTDGAARHITTPDLAGLDPSGLRDPAVIRYPTFDGRQVPAFWFTPAGAGPWPVVVDVHGGPESQRRPNYAPVTQFLLARGYAVLAPNVRGSTGYGKTYCHLDDVGRRPDAVADLAAAADWLAGRADVRPDRIAVMVQSYGGFMVLAALTSHPERWAAGVDVVGIANFATFLAQTGPWRRRTRAAEYGDPERDADVLREISPIHRVDRIAAPLLVIHGRNDPRVPLAEAEQIVAALRERGRDVELLVFDDEGHGLVKRGNRVAGYGAVERFLERTVGGQ